jgi:NAD(P)-dependent dehydrogenase (short-subunit alcohol dehydrogenase family)
MSGSAGTGTAGHRRRDASVAVVGAGDYIGAAIARQFAREGYVVHCGRRNGDKLAPLVAEIKAAGGVCVGHTLDARDEDAVAQFMRAADAGAPLEAAVFNIGANVNFPLLERPNGYSEKCGNWPAMPAS